MSNDHRNGYSAGYKGYPLKKGASKAYKEGHAKGRVHGAKRKKRLP